MTKVYIISLYMPFENYMPPEEVFFDKVKAEVRARELTDDLGEQNNRYEVTELEVQ